MIIVAVATEYVFHACYIKALITTLITTICWYWS